MMIDHNVPITELPPLDEDERDDACYRGRDRAWSALVSLFDQYSRDQGLTYERLGQRIKRSKSQVQRWLRSSFNMNLKSLGLLAEGLNADLYIEVRPRKPVPDGQNYVHPQEAAQTLIGTERHRPAGTNAAGRLRHYDAEPAAISAPAPTRVLELQVRAYADA